MRRTTVIVDENLTDDGMLAAVALAHDVFLFHNDKDFRPIGTYFGLRVL
jgi:predicted nucleic acid-binding protein